MRAHLLAALAFFASASWSCSDPSDSCGGRSCMDGGASGDGASDARRDGSTQRPTDLLSLRLDPPMAQLTVSAGMPAPTQPFRAFAMQRDGRERELVGTDVGFVLSDNTFGSVSASGVYTPPSRGGTVRVTANSPLGLLGSLQATATVSVRYESVTMGMGVPADIATQFMGAMTVSDAAQGPGVDYPLAGAVMPRNVFAPQLMWTPHHMGAGRNDVYRVLVLRADAAIVGYFSAGALGFDHSWTPAAAPWAALASTDVGTDLTISVSVLSGGRVYTGDVRRFRTVDAVIAGAVYYWSPSAGRLRRVDVEQGRRVDFMPNPGSGCIGCHSVSRDGTRLSGMLENPAEDVAEYDLTRDLTGNPAPTLFRRHAAVRRCTSFSPDNARAVWADCGANPSTENLSVIDSATGNVAPNGAFMAGGFDPEWSPSLGSGRSAIAYTDRSNNLAVVDVMGDTYGAPRVLHMAASSPGGNVDWHPTWTPNGQWLAYQHGATRRTAVETQGGAGIAASLWMLNADGTRNVRLDNASGGAMANNSYRPVFSPFDSGEYFWVLFTSTRDYGNATAGLRGAKQIWVAAVRDRPDGAHDPSEVAYYLEGQERGTALSPYWVPPPCRANGDRCGSGGDCCSGECNLDTGSSGVCRPPSMQCRSRGETCSSGSDCCTGLVCGDGRLCDNPPPG